MANYYYLADKKNKNLVYLGSSINDISFFQEYEDFKKLFDYFLFDNEEANLKEKVVEIIEKIKTLPVSKLKDEITFEDIVILMKCAEKSLLFLDSFGELFGFVYMYLVNDDYYDLEVVSEYRLTEGNEFKDYRKIDYEEWKKEDEK